MCKSAFLNFQACAFNHSATLPAVYLHALKAATSLTFQKAFG